MSVRRRNEEIEVLRALGVLLVIFEHINTLLFWRTENFDDYVNAYGGVDLFFCVSGFVITSAFGAGLTEAAASADRYWPTVLAFWVRRIYRILPLAWTVLFVNLVVSLLVFGHGLLGFVGDFLSVFLYIENFHYARCVVAASKYCGPNGIYWSLSLEEQFYLAFPFLLLLPRRYAVAALVAIVLVFAVLPRTTLVWMVRLDAIALGVLLAFAMPFQPYRVFEPRALASTALRWPIVAILLTALVVVPAGAGLVTFFPTIVSLIALGLVFVASYDKGYLMPIGAARTAMVWVGQRSFALYLLHNTVFWIIRGAANRLFPGAAHGGIAVICYLASAAILLALASDLSFRLLETPLRRRGQRIAARILEQPTVADVTCPDQLRPRRAAAR
jgi:peptidoglycan/LPS O-acetylase OafA/YrhL